MAQFDRHTRARMALGGALLLGAMAPQAAMAGGFYIAEQSVKGTGRAYSGEVADQGAESLWWNPAAIGGLQGGSSSLGVSGILPFAHVNNVNTQITRPGQAAAAVGGDQTTANPIIRAGVPSGAIAHSITRNIAVGLSITAPYNFTTEYPSTSWTRYTAEKTRLRTMDIQPTLAVQLMPGLSVGAGINIERVSANFNNALPNVSPLMADGQQALAGMGWDVGYSVGAQYHQGRLSLGISYKSAIKHHLDGYLAISGLQYPLSGSNGSSTTTADFSTPWQVVFGARYAVTPKLTLNAQATRFGWSEFSAITLGAPFNTSIPENYKDSWDVAVGADYTLSPKWTLRGGIARDVSPVRDDQRDARVPDGNRWVFALGTTRSFGKAFKLDGAVQYISVASGAINRSTLDYAGTLVQTPISVDGTVTGSKVLVLSLGGRLSF